MMTEDEWQQFEKQRREPWHWYLAESAKIRDRLLQLQGGICAICGTPMNDGTHWGAATNDHVIPKSAGGQDRLGNLVAAHRSCNMRKGSDRPSGCELVWLLAVNNRLGVEPMRW